MKRMMVLLATSFIVGGCATTYTYDGKKYNSQEQVVAAQRENIERHLKDITPLPKPVTHNKLIFIAPGYQAFMDAQKDMDQKAGVTRNSVQQADAEIKAKDAAGNLEFTAEMIKKRNLYQHVSFVASPTYTVPEPNVSEAEDVMYISCSYTSDGKHSACGTFYVSKKYGKQIFAPDKSNPDYKERNKALLQAVEALAIRE